jgi:Uma2 family endonuclease
VTKRKWYAQAGVPHYWLLDGSAKSLECLRLVGNVYEVDQSASAGEEVRPSLFPGLVIRLAELWA